MVTRAQLDGELARLREDGAAAAEALVADVASLKDEVHELRAGLDELRRDAADLLSQTRRRAQGAEPEPEPEPGLGGENVKIVKRSVVYCGGPGSTTNDGTFDYSQCADRAFATCHADACAGHTGHRRAQVGGTCDAMRLAQDSDAINRECCDEPMEDCTGGYPRTCNAGCASLFLPFWDGCRSALGHDISHFEPVVALCQAAAHSAPSLAEQLNVECTDGTAAVDCVPECSELYHGFLMLLNIEGDDSKLSCELHRGLYSWVGAATDGGYLGNDIESFISAVVSGAAGRYMVTTFEPANMHTDLTIRPGQVVSVSAGLPNPVAWGRAAIAVGERGSLALSMLKLDGALGANSGALELTVSSCTLTDGGNVLLNDATVTFTNTDLGFRSLASAGGSITLTSCTGRLSGLRVVSSTFSMDATSTLSLGGYVSIVFAGQVVLSNAEFDEGVQFTIGSGTRCMLDSCTVPPSASLTVSSGGHLTLDGVSTGSVGAGFTVSGGSLSLQNLAMSAGSLTSAGTGGVPGSQTRLDTVSVLQHPEWGALSGTITTRADGSATSDMPSWSTVTRKLPGMFAVASGPCTVSAGGVCVGRPNGYSPNEDCSISVGGAGGALAPCGSSQACNTVRCVSSPGDGVTHFNLGGNSYVAINLQQSTTCPTSTVTLAAGATVSWHSDGSRPPGAHDWTNNVGGDWQICFERPSLVDEYCDARGLQVDACGACGGDGSSCAGCDGVPNSGLTVDACGQCGGAGGEECDDAAGVCGGQIGMDYGGNVMGSDGVDCGYAQVLMFIVNSDEWSAPAWFAGATRIDSSMDSPLQCQRRCFEDPNCDFFSYDLTAGDGSASQHPFGVDLGGARFHECMFKEGYTEPRCTENPYGPWTSEDPQWRGLAGPGVACEASADHGLPIRYEGSFAYEYQGCFADPQGYRDMSGLVPYDPSSHRLNQWGNLFVAANTGLSDCAHICRDFEYFGLQTSDECFCGNSFGSAGPAMNCGDMGANCADGNVDTCGSTNAVFAVPSGTRGNGR